MMIARDVVRTVWPERGDEHGPLAPMLVALTLVTGLVDAVSYIKLGHVFVANMTGNVGDLRSVARPLAGTVDSHRAVGVSRCLPA
jgi:hypothetical protein